MKKMIKSVLVIIFTIFSITSFAQITYPASAQAITRGLDSTLLTVRIVFPSVCVSPIVTINLGASNTPGLVEYIPSTITKIGGSASLTISENNISNLANPIFSVSGSPTAGQDIIFTIKRRANCGSAAASKDNIIVSGSCSLSEIDPNINSYNLLAPALTLSPPTTLSNANVGSIYNRTISITNGGNGCLDTLGFWIKYPPASLALNSLKIGVTTIIPFFQNADSAYFKVYGSALSSDNLLCNGETVIFTENVTVLLCDATTNYGANWNIFTNNDVCETTAITSEITMSNNLPLIAVTMPTYNLNWCPDGDYVTRQLMLVNTGGVATNFKLTYWGWNPGAAYLNYTDTSNWVIKSKTGALLGNLKNFGTIPTRNLPFYNTACVAETNKFDENVNMEIPSNIFIPANDTVYIDFRVYHNNVTCTPMQCYPDYYGWEDNDISFSYQNQCANSTNSIPRFSLNQTGYPRSQYIISVDPDLVGGKPFNYNISYGSLISTVKPTSGRSYIFIKLPIDITTNGPITHTLQVAYGTPYPINIPYFQSNDTLFIDMQENTYAAGDINIPLISTCGSGGVKQFNMGHLHWWDSTSCATFPLSLACKSISTNVHCPGCNIGGATPLDFQLRRITYGYEDTNNDNFPDNFTGTPNPAILNLKNTLNGDTVLGKWNIQVYNNVAVGDPNNGVPFNHLYIDYPLTKYNAGTFASGYLQYPYLYNPVPNALATIYPAGGGASFTCTVTPTIINDIAHYDFSSCKASWGNGDSLVVEAKYTIGAYAHSGGYEQAFTTVQVYSSYLPQANPTFAPIPLTTYTCDHFQNYVNALYCYSSVYAYTTQLNGCTDRTLTYGLEYSIVDNGQPIKFPYEARLISVPDTVIMRIPAGFQYEPNSAEIRGGYTIPSTGNIVPTANVVVSGNFVKLVNLKSLFTNYGGSITLRAEYAGIAFIIKVLPTCESVVGLTGTKAHEVITAGNGLNTPLSYHMYTPWGGHNVIDSAYTVANVNYNAPQPIFTGGGTVISTDGTASWNVVLQNGSNTLTAPNSWFYINPTNGIT
ncbi:MAG: hypothetical protein ABL929_09040, partial [Ferruginibacter sp.]